MLCTMVTMVTIHSQYYSELFLVFFSAQNWTSVPLKLKMRKSSLSSSSEELSSPSPALHRLKAPSLDLLTPHHNPPHTQHTPSVLHTLLAQKIKALISPIVLPPVSSPATPSHSLIPQWDTTQVSTVCACSL